MRPQDLGISLPGSFCARQVLTLFLALYRQGEEGQPGERVFGVDLGALHPQQQRLRHGFPRGCLRSPDPAHPLQGALQLEEGIWR